MYLTVISLHIVEAVVPLRSRLLITLILIIDKPVFKDQTLGLTVHNELGVRSSLFLISVA